MRPYNFFSKSTIENLPVPDNLITLQILKGLQFALTIIKEHICLLENVLIEALRQGFKNKSVNEKLKTEQGTICKVLKIAGFKNSFPFNRKPVRLQFPGKRLIAFTLKELNFNNPLIVNTKKDIVFLLQQLNIYKQKLHCNDEYLYILIKMFRADYFVYNLKASLIQSEYRQKQLSILNELLKDVRKYCLLCLSDMDTEYIKEFYCHLLSLLMEKIKSIIETEDYCNYQQLETLFIQFKPRMFKSITENLCVKTIKALLEEINTVIGKRLYG